MEKIALNEFDSSNEAVIMPGHEKYDIKLPEVAVFAFVGEVIYEYAKERNLVPLQYFKTISKDYPVYVDVIDGKKITICEAPLGAPAAVSFLDWLIAYGVRRIISTGSCGVLKDIPENAFLVPARALRDEGTSFHYMEPGRYVETDSELCKKIEKIFAEKNIPYTEVTTWTTDGFFRETAGKIAARKEEGCTCVDMECAALSACAKFRGAQFAQFFFTADSLANTDAYDERNWGEDSLRPALDIALDIAKSI